MDPTTNRVRIAAPKANRILKLGNGMLIPEVRTCDETWMCRNQTRCRTALHPGIQGVCVRPSVVQVRSDQKKLRETVNPQETADSISLCSGCHRMRLSNDSIPKKRKIDRPDTTKKMRLCQGLHFYEMHDGTFRQLGNIYLPIFQTITL